MSKEIESIEREIIIDEDPDLSWLNQTDEQMGEGFEAAAKTRLADYRLGEWHMTGIRAKAVLTVNGVSHTILSAGLWGVESDSSEEYLNEVYLNELEALAATLVELGFPEADVLAQAPQLVFKP